MKAISNYIQESLDIDNIFWKIESWFKIHPNEYDDFINMLVYAQQHIPVSIDDIQTYVKSSNINYKEFISFIYDDFTNFTDNDAEYYNKLKKIFEICINNKLRF